MLWQQILSLPTGQAQVGILATFDLLEMARLSGYQLLGY